MHVEIDHFVTGVKKKFPDYFNGKSVLEVGSQNINGSVRPHFTACHYVGIDLGEASGVDIVISIINYNLPLAFDVVISSEMLEHCDVWREALLQMYMNVKHGGIFILTCAGPTRQEHGTRKISPGDSQFTLDHYRNISKEDFTSILPLTLFSECSLELARGDADLYFWGIKK